VYSRASRTVKFLQSVHHSTLPKFSIALILIWFVSDLYISILMIGKKIEKKATERINADNIVNKPLVADLYESLFAK
jgi:hypothetical protein